MAVGTFWGYDVSNSPIVAAGFLALFDDLQSGKQEAAENE
jgi:hypothetical protein